MLLIMRITSDELLAVLTSMTLNDLKPLTQKYKVLVFFAIFGCGADFKGELRRNDWR